MADADEPRSAAPAKRKRRKAALDARIAATGVAACAFFGMLVGMGLPDDPDPAQTAPVARPARRDTAGAVAAPPPAPAAPPPVATPTPVAPPEPVAPPPPPPTSSGGS